ncbi:MAG: hypothetical protein U1E05_06630 [Patescibacteria group bacterium]|nr:hypothetical protein [Patescibacteria group bacterium]
MLHGRCCSRGAMLVGVVLLVVLSGCNRQPYGTTAVRGKVTYEDGTLIPAPAMTIYFEPQQESIDEKTFPRRGFAQVDVADGTFNRATTYEPGDGLIAGPHKVVIEVTGEGGVPDYRFFPRAYSDAATTPLTIEVDGKQELTLTVPKL